MKRLIEIVNTNQLKIVCARINHLTKYGYLNGEVAKNSRDFWDIFQSNRNNGYRQFVYGEKEIEADDFIIAKEYEVDEYIKKYSIDYLGEFKRLKDANENKHLTYEDDRIEGKVIGFEFNWMNMKEMEFIRGENRFKNADISAVRELLKMNELPLMTHFIVGESNYELAKENEINKMGTALTYARFSPEQIIKDDWSDDVIRFTSIIRDFEW